VIWNNTAQMGSQNVHCIGNLQPLWSSGLPSSSHSRCIPTPGTGSSRRKICHPRSTGRPNKSTTHVLASCRRCKPKLPLGVRLARATSTTSLLGHTRSHRNFTQVRSEPTHLLARSSTAKYAKAPMHARPTMQINADYSAFCKKRAAAWSWA
jgi:hypothetical protein